MAAAEAAADIDDSIKRKRILVSLHQRGWRNDVESWG